jgi:hypothetical protein
VLGFAVSTSLSDSFSYPVPYCPIRQEWLQIFEVVYKISKFRIG